MWWKRRKSAHPAAHPAVREGRRVVREDLVAPVAPEQALVGLVLVASADLREALAAAVSAAAVAILPAGAAASDPVDLPVPVLGLGAHPELRVNLTDATPSGVAKAAVVRPGKVVRDRRDSCLGMTTRRVRPRNRPRRSRRKNPTGLR